MALKPKTETKINVAMRRFICWLKYRAIGPFALTKAELKDLVRSGLVTATTAPKAAVARSYLTTHAQTTNLPAPQTTRNSSIDFLENMFGRYSDKAAQQLTTDLLGRIEAGIMPLVNHRDGGLYDKASAKKQIGQAISDTVKDYKTRWKMIVDTELSRAANHGAMDAILHSNQDKSPDDIVCYKVGPSDSICCRECLRFWFWDDGVTPRVYTMSELVGGGTNIGLKRKDWKPGISPSHPNCRHFILQELKPGYGFQGNKKVYIGKDHDELARQRGIRVK